MSKQFHMVKGKDAAGDEDVPVAIAIRHLLAGFTRPMILLEYKMADTYHHFEVPKRPG